MSVSLFIAEQKDCNIMLVIRENDMGKVKKILADNLTSLGVFPHVYNMSNIWIKENDVNVYIARADYISDMRGRKVDHLFIAENVHTAGTRRAIGYTQAGNMNFSVRTFKF
jgi:hypothetical protein